MNDLAILHLSDLHIDGNGRSYSKLLKGLLSDLKKETAKIPDRKLVITVTGDLIHQGNKNSIPAAKHFFEDLKDTIGQKVIGIYIVPGNHDKARTKENQFLIPAYRNIRNAHSDNFGDTFFQSLWPIQLQTYSEEFGSGYLELTQYIYTLFDVDCSKAFVKDTFGVDILSVDGQKYCFVLLNTAWSAADDNDNRNLIFGEFQMEKIKSSFHELTDDLNSSPCLTLVLGHHPIGCLHGAEEDLVFTEMISFEELDANVYLCGHTHDRTIINWFNNRHSLNTLMTGIGWPESGNGMRVGDHYYSLYIFNVAENSIDIYVRNTNDGGTFFPDFKIYTNNFNTETKKLVLPIHAQEAHAYISLGTGPKIHEKAIYASNNFLLYTRCFTERISKFCQETGRWLESDKNQLFEDLDLSYLKSDQNPTAEIAEEILYNYLFAEMHNVVQDDESIIDSILMHNQNLIFEMFQGYLQRICQRLQRILLYDQIEESDIVRFHFRYLFDRNTYLYRNLCSSFSRDIEIEEYELSDIKYSDLIEAADCTNQSLIYSANEQICTLKLNKKWVNFITVIPKFSGNEFKRKISEDTTKVVPYITFGVTINNSKFNNLLYCMDFYSINAILKNILDSYVNSYKIDTGKFCTWVRDQQRKEA